MSYKALYRQWRPKNFDEMVGQEHVTKVLKNQIQSNQTGHAYLFCGTRGTGKTSAAKIFAKGVNCLSEKDTKPCGECENCKSIQEETFIDVIEMDAASNNGVDNIRELRESIKYPPAKGKYKVYIIDEVHMLSTGAFNALLKTLEEPPSYIKFILATTEVHKLPATILSRCQRFDFRRISEQEMAERMKYICDNMGISMDMSALMLIARNAEGSVRDALSILDQCLALGSKAISRDDVIEILGTADDVFLLELTDCIAEKKSSDAIMLVHRIITEGKDIQQLIKDLIYHYRNLMICNISKDIESIIPMSSENLECLKEQSNKLSISAINNAIMELSKTSADAKWSSQPRVLLELAVITLSTPELNTSVEGLVERITALEKALKNGKNEAGVVSVIKEVPEQNDTIKEEVSEKNKAKLSNKKDAAESPIEKYSEKEFQSIWSDIINEAREERPSLTMLSQGITLISMDEKSFMLHAESDAKREYLLLNKDLIEEIFSKHTKKSLKLQCIDVNRPKTDKTNEDEEIKKELESIFGSEKVSIIDTTDN